MVSYSITGYDKKPSYDINSDAVKMKSWANEIMVGCLFVFLPKLLILCWYDENHIFPQLASSTIKTRRLFTQKYFRWSTSSSVLKIYLKTCTLNNPHDRKKTRMGWVLETKYKFCSSTPLTTWLKWFVLISHSWYTFDNSTGSTSCLVSCFIHFHENII